MFQNKYIFMQFVTQTVINRLTKIYTDFVTIRIYESVEPYVIVRVNIKLVRQNVRSVNK